jgi:hypothetical protein
MVAVIRRPLKFGVFFFTVLQVGVRGSLVSCAGYGPRFRFGLRSEGGGSAVDQVDVEREGEETAECGRKEFMWVDNSTGLQARTKQLTIAQEACRRILL